MLIVESRSAMKAAGNGEYMSLSLAVIH